MASPGDRKPLRPGLLEGASVLVGAGSAGPFAGEIERRLSELGARVARVGTVTPVEGDAAAEEQLAEREVARALETLGEARLVAVDAAWSEGGEEELEQTMRLTWAVTRAAANAAFLDPGREGRIVLVAPGSGELAASAAAALENLARTLSIEWARHGVTSVALAPGPQTGPGEVAEVVAYLASPAGAYLSGTLLDLRGSG